MSSAWRTVLRRILRLRWSLAADSMVITGDARHLSTRSIPWLTSKKHWVLLAGWSEGHAGLTTAHGWLTAPSGAAPGWWGPAGPRHHGSSGTRPPAPTPSAASLSGGCPPSSPPTCTCPPVLRPAGRARRQRVGIATGTCPTRGPRPGRGAGFPGETGVLTGTRSLSGPLSSCRARQRGAGKSYLGKADPAPTQQRGPLVSGKQSSLRETGPRSLQCRLDEGNLQLHLGPRGIRSADLCRDPLCHVNVMASGEKGGENRFPGWGPTHGYHHWHSGGREAGPVCHQVTDSRPPATPPAPTRLPSGFIPISPGPCLLLWPKSFPSQFWNPGISSRGWCPSTIPKGRENETQGSSSPERDKIWCSCRTQGTEAWLWGEKVAGVPLCFLWLCHSAYGILVPPPWIKLLTPALEAQSPN